MGTTRRTAVTVPAERIFGRAPSPTDRSALFGLGIYRTVTALWAVTVALIDARSEVLVRPSLAFAILGPLVLWSVLTVVLARRAPEALLGTGAQVIDIALGVLVVAAEWFTYGGGHPLRFGAMWQLAPVIGAGLRFGALGGLLVGTGLGVVNAVALSIAEGMDGRILAAVSAVVLMGVAGAAAGAILDHLRHVEDDLAEARARERIAVTLHDGVLQTLAAIQRRSDDSELVALASDQDRDLRRWIRGEPSPGDGPGGPSEPGRASDLVAAMHELADRLRSRDGSQLEVVAVTAPTPTAEAAEALLSAVAEAITNANKHAEASRVTVFLDSDTEVIECSVTDDGRGFDVGASAGGFGIDGSMRGPVEDLGGSVGLSSRQGFGTEVTITMPLNARRRRP